MANLWQDLPRSFPIPGLNMPWIDQVAVLVLIVFTLLGMRRGLWWQVIRLLGIIASVALARGLSPRFTPALQRALPEVNDSVAQGSVWFGLFLGGMVIASLLGLIGKRALETMQLGLFDRLGGGVAGAMSGALLHAAALVVLIALAPQWSQRNLGGTRSAFLLEALVQKAHLMVDAQAAERMRPVIEERSRRLQDASPPPEANGPR